MSTRPRTDAVISIIEAAPGGLITREIADIMAANYHAVHAILGRLYESKAVAWTREPGYKAPHRVRVYSLAHAPKHAQIGKPGLAPCPSGPRIAAKALRHERPIDMSRAKITRLPNNFGVLKLPHDYRSALDPLECNPWANAAVGDAA